MAQLHITVLVPIAPGCEDGVAQALGSVRAPDRRATRELGHFVHFMSMFVVPAVERKPAVAQEPAVEQEPAALLVEICADGPQDEALRRWADAMAATLTPVLHAAGHGVEREDVLPFLRRHLVRGDTRLFRRPTLAHFGTPGMAAQRIRNERRLARFVRAKLANPAVRTGGALDTLNAVRSEVFQEPGLKWAFDVEPVPLLQPAKPARDVGMSLVVAALRDYLWWLPVIAFLAAAAHLDLLEQLLDGTCCSQGLWPFIAWSFFFLFVSVLVLGALGAIGYFALRRQESAEVPIDREPDARALADILARENRDFVVQNHLAAVSIVKRGWFRPDLLRFAMWTIAELRQVRSRPGHLDRMGTIHFARWLLLPSRRWFPFRWRDRGVDRLVFMSNYDGSWQSYLEDFIARLAEGLTSIWSNTVDFPKTDNLVAGGAGDGERFKRWARRQQVPSWYWFSTYTRLTTDAIRRNAAIRYGLASAITEQEAARWLSLFGHVDPGEVDKEQVSAIAFGPMADLRFARCLLIRFGPVTPGQGNVARRWLRSIKDELSRGEHAVLEPHALVAAFTSDGLRKLELDEAALSTFPAAFQMGMSDPQRARALGDDPSRWAADWTGVDAVVLVYARDALRLARKVRVLEGRCVEVLAKPPRVPVAEIPLMPLPARIPGSRTRPPVIEPFGFRDGVSQPRMRGSRGWARPEYAPHVVEPGEIVLGYPDNLGMLPPTPRCRGVDIGRNGTFLVIRQLEQDVAAFTGYVARQAARIAGTPQDPGFSGSDLEHWVAAKMMGRWRDGRSLVRNPHAPATGSGVEPDNDFLFGQEDPNGQRCPLGAHIRRANPRDSFEPGSQKQLAISNRHRILRVSRQYEPKAGAKPGMLFMCVNANIERQFEFLQQTWLLGPNFHGLDDEVDPIVGHRGMAEPFTVGTPRGPIRYEAVSKFVDVLGGAYLFVPSKDALEHILQAD